MTSATGGGHDSHARATEAWCQRIFGDEVIVKVDHTLENSHQVHRAGLETYHFIQTRAPWLQHLYYNFIELNELFNKGTVAFGKEYYVRLLEDFRPDAILSVHDCLNFGYAEIAREVLGPYVRFGTYCMEFGGGYGFSRNWINKTVDCFFARTEEVAVEGHRRGLPADKVSVAGHWTDPSFYEPDLNPAEREVFLTKLGLAPDLFTVLISTGGAGAQNHLAFLEALLPLGRRLQVIALCGRQTNARQEVEAWAKEHPGLKVQALAFSDEMAKLLRVVSIVVARPGAATSGETFLSGCPVLFNVLGGMMPQEMPNWRYFRRRNIAQLVRRPGDLPKILQNYLEHPAALAAQRTRLKELRDSTSPEKGLRLLLGL